MKQYFRARGQDFAVEWLSGVARVEGRSISLAWLDGNEGDWLLEIDGQPARVRWAQQGRQIWLHLNGRSYQFEKVAGGRGVAGGGGNAEGLLRAPMPGQVRAVYVEASAKVAEGQELLLLEAMKMEMRIQAPRAARVAVLNVAAGDTVEKDQVLVELDGEET